MQQVIMDFWVLDNEKLQVRYSDDVKLGFSKILFIEFTEALERGVLVNVLEHKFVSSLSGVCSTRCRKVEVTLVIPVVSWGCRLDEGEEEERIRTEEQVVRQKEEPRGQIFVCIQGHWESEKRH